MKSTEIHLIRLAGKLNKKYLNNSKKSANSKLQNVKSKSMKRERSSCRLIRELHRTLVLISKRGQRVLRL